jgi:hypothetical protein
MELCYTFAIGCGGKGKERFLVTCNQKSENEKRKELPMGEYVDSISCIFEKKKELL